MAKCYVSNDILTADNSSIEHIIPNAFGGKLKSKYLLTKEVNNRFGETIDKALTKSINLATLIGIKRDRGAPPKLLAKDISGKKHLVYSKDKIKMKYQPLELQESIDGQPSIEVPISQEEHLVKKLKKDNPSMTDEEVRNRISEFTYNNGNPYPIYFQNHNQILNEIDAYRGVAKIATNFYFYKVGKSTYCNNVLDFVNSNTNRPGIVRYHYPTSDRIALGDNEISHILHLVGDYTERILYCYIELFNTHNFIVELSTEYDGPNLEESYVYCLKEDKESIKNINIRFTRQEFMKLPCPGPDDLENLYTEKFERVAKIEGMAIVSTELSELTNIN